MPGHRQVTLYVDAGLYERVRFAAYTLGEDIYEFAGAALRASLAARLTRTQSDAVESMSRQKREADAAKAARRPVRRRG
jgi:hypothetical protein